MSAHLHFLGSNKYWIWVSPHVYRSTNRDSKRSLNRRHVEARESSSSEIRKKIRYGYPPENVPRNRRKNCTSCHFITSLSSYLYLIFFFYPSYFLFFRDINFFFLFNSFFFHALLRSNNLSLTSLYWRACSCTRYETIRSVLRSNRQCIQFSARKFDFWSRVVREKYQDNHRPKLPCNFL